jgi:nitroimidazol reductase NimA-like FMN-containing flavoprotein (pyridoxamine 5'-phosphate oxidase superfamily)
MSTLKSPRVTIRRMPERGRYDRASLDAVLDAGFVCHLGLSVEGQPYVIPTIYGRSGDDLFVHGSAASRTLRALGKGAPACLTVTHLDGVVVARSTFHSSLNYRSAVLLGTAHPVEDRASKAAALRAITEHLLQGRWEEARPPTPRELDATSVLRLPIGEASVKIRVGPPSDDEADYALPIWAGEIPLRTVAGRPVSDVRLAPGLEPAPSVGRFLERHR